MSLFRTQTGDDTETLDELVVDHLRGAMEM